jgi:hypothetical protein
VWDFVDDEIWEDMGRKLGMNEEKARPGRGEREREEEEDVERTVIGSEEGAQLVRLCSLMSPPLVTVEQSSQQRPFTNRKII